MQDVGEHMSVQGVRKLSCAELQAFLDERCREPGIADCDREELDAAAACSIAVLTHGSAEHLQQAAEEALSPVPGLYSTGAFPCVIMVIRMSVNVKMHDFNAAVDRVEATVRDLAGEGGIRSFLMLASVEEEDGDAVVDIILTDSAA